MSNTKTPKNEASPASAPLQKSREQKLEALLEKAASTIEAQNERIAKLESKLSKESPPAQITSQESSVDHDPTANETDVYPGKESSVADATTTTDTGGAFVVKGLQERIAALESKLSKGSAASPKTVKVSSPTPFAKAAPASEKESGIAGLVRKSLEFNNTYLGGSEDQAYEIDSRITKLLDEA